MWPHLGPHRPEPGRHLVQHRDVEVAIHSLRQRLRDRGGGRQQQVRVYPLLAERRALPNAEAMLLVDDREPEPLEGHGLLDESVRANDDVELTGGEAGEYLLTR